jgi:hypothetical protein
VLRSMWARGWRAWLWALALVPGVCLAAGAIRLGKVERSIRGEPTYKSGSPEYALLLFGPEARLRVWLVLDGEGLYLDRDGDGDLTGKDEHFAKVSDCRNVTLADPDGKTSYVITHVSTFRDEESKRHSVLVNVDVKGPAKYRQYCDVEVVKDRAKARIAHFHGPLTAGPATVLWKVPEALVLRKGDKPTDLNLVIGTMDAANGCWTVVRTHGVKEASAFPEGVVPEVEVTFPPAKPGAPAVTKRYALDKFC